MKVSRREFLKAGIVSVGAVASIGLFGCAPQQGASSSKEANTSEGANVDTNTENTESSTQANPAASAVNSASPAVVYFSCTGNTQAVAEKIAAATDGALMRIEPAEPYTPADLDYNSDRRANSEQSSGTARPALAAPVPDVAGYDTVYLGYPIWWGEAPRVVLTFLESADLAGKTVIPFCTSGSSPISGSIAEIEQAAPGANVLEGRRFSASASQQAIDSWVSESHN